MSGGGGPFSDGDFSSQLTDKIRSGSSSTRIQPALWTETPRPRGQVADDLIPRYGITTLHDPHHAQINVIFELYGWGLMRFFALGLSLLRFRVWESQVLTN